MILAYLLNYLFTYSLTYLLICDIIGKTRKFQKSSFSQTQSRNCKPGHGVRGPEP